MSLTVTSLSPIPDVKIIRPRKFGDDRGFFSETYSARAFKEAGIDIDFIQDNHSFSAERGTVRGLHFQTPPQAQAKLLRVTRGAILDVVVDIRQGSPTYGRHVSAVISADEWNQIYVPVGFAHGFCTLEENSEVQYKVSAYYAPECDRGLAWDDPDLGIVWPVEAQAAILSAKDRNWPRLRDLQPAFAYTAS